jgi:hypothetical protein
MKAFIQPLGIAATLLLGVSPLFAINQYVQPATQPASAQPVVVDPRASALGEVNKLLDAKVDEAVVVAYIHNSGVRFNLSATDIIALKDRGASPEVLRALVESQPAATASATAPSVEAPMTPGGASYPATYPSGYDYSAYSSYPYYSDYYPYYYPSYAYYNYGWPYFYFGFYPFCSSGFCSFNHFHGGHFHDGFHSHGGLVATRSAMGVSGFHGSTAFHASPTFHTSAATGFHGGASFHGGGGGGFHSSGFSGGFHGGGGGGFHGGGGGGHR